MTFLFDITVLYYSTPIFYKIYKIDNVEYFARPSDENMRPFKLKKDFGYWVSEGGYTHRLAIEVGKEIDRLQSLEGL